MERREDIDAWADALLDQHRTAPRGTSKLLNEPAPLHELPAGMQMWAKLGGVHPTRSQAERMRKAADRHALFSKWEAIFTIIGAVALMVFVVSFLGSF